MDNLIDLSSVFPDVAFTQRLMEAWRENGEYLPPKGTPAYRKQVLELARFAAECKPSRRRWKFKRVKL